MTGQPRASDWSQTPARLGADDRPHAVSDIRPLSAAEEFLALDEMSVLDETREDARPAGELPNPHEDAEGARAD
jgi:hypothetical protein